MQAGKVVGVGAGVVSGVRERERNKRAKFAPDKQWNLLNVRETKRTLFKNSRGPSAGRGSFLARKGSKVSRVGLMLGRKNDGGGGRLGTTVGI